MAHLVVRTTLFRVDGGEETELATDESPDFAKAADAEDEFVARTGGSAVEDCAVCDIPELDITMGDEDDEEDEDEDE